MKGRLHLLASFALTAALLPAATASAQGSLCSNTATVGWQTDLAAMQVTGAVVEVPGCEEGDFVGLELVLDDGLTVPDDGPLGTEAKDGFATFDLRPLDVGIEPVIGVRVFLAVEGQPTPVVLITVEQRFFNSAGHEQIGLRITTELLVPEGRFYAVPQPTAGYEAVDCTSVTLVTQETPISTGVGEFIAERSGLHIACYRLVPGPRGGPPGAEEPEVLDEVTENDQPGMQDEALQTDDPAERDLQADPRAAERDVEDSALSATVLGRTLARTGAGSLPLGLLGASLFIVGGGLLLSRRRGGVLRSSVRKLYPGG